MKLTATEIKRRLKNFASLQVRRKNKHEGISLEDYPFSEKEFVYLSKLSERHWRNKLKDKNLLLATKVKKMQQEYFIEKHDSMLCLLKILATLPPTQKQKKSVRYLKARKQILKMKYKGINIKD